MDSKISKCNKLIEIIKKLLINVLRNALLKIYKSFIRRYLDYTDIIYDKSNNKSKIENVQYTACFAMAGVFQGTCTECLYRELGLESINDTRWFRQRFFFIKS